MRRLILAVIAVVLVNLPWANDAWVQHQIDARGVDVQATVVKDAEKHGQNFLSYRLPTSIDPQQHLYGIQVSPAAYRDAVANGTIPARVVPGSPNENKVQGQATSSMVWVIAAIGDAIILLVLGVVLRRRRLWTRFKVTAVEDDVLTLSVGATSLVAQLADDVATRAAINPVVGGAVKGALALIPETDVVEGPPIGEITHLEGPRYRIAGRVRSVRPARTDLLLENGYVMAVVSDEVEHEAELRGAAIVTGTLLLSSSKL